MKFSYDSNKKELQVQAEFLEDLYFLSKLIEENDSVEGMSLRRFKATDKESESGEKKPVKLRLKVKSAEFSEHANKLRILGTILAGEPEEFAPKGASHTLDVELNSRITITKKLSEYHLQILEDAKKSARKVEVAAIAMDDEKATFATIGSKGIKFEFEIECHASKRNLKEFDAAKLSYFGDILKQLKAKEGHATAIVVAGPGFTKDEFQKFISNKDEKLARKVVFEHASTSERPAIVELLKRGVLSKVLEEQKFQEEVTLLEKFKESIAKQDGLAAYGINEVSRALEYKAIQVLMILDEALRKADDNLTNLVESVRLNKGKIVVFNSQDDAGKEFSQFGIAALLKFKLSYH